MLKIERIIIHHSLTKDSKTVSWQAIRRYHTKTLGWDQIGYHFGVELVDDHYEILVGRMFNEPGAHCIQQGMNRRSLGICIIGNFDYNPVPSAQWIVAACFTASLLMQFNLPVSAVRGHRYYAPYKSCPGKNFDMNLFREQVLSYM